MRFQVPQFIETETKLIGPFTLKQFLFIATGAVIVFLLQYAVSTIYVIMIGLPVVIFSFALAFYKVDGIPLPKYLLMALSYISGPKRYQFRKDDSNSTQIR